MSGPLSVPFAALAVWASNRGQKILWGCLAAICAVFATYRVWKGERVRASLDIDSLKSSQESEINSLRTKKDAEIAVLSGKVQELSRKPYSEELERMAKQVLFQQMTLEGRIALRHLMIHEPIEVGRTFTHDITQDRLHAQLGVAMQSAIVQHRVEEHGLRRTYWIINPRFRPILERVLYEE